MTDDNGGDARRMKGDRSGDDRSASDRPGTVRVQFQPTGKRVDVPQGTDLLDAARRAGITLTATCGGLGSCGQCRVTVLSGPVSQPGEGETLALGPLETIAGRRLACQTRALGNVVVDVPKSSVLAGQRLQTESDLGEALETFPLDPPVKAYSLEVDKPTLQDARSDLTRVLDALRERDGRDGGDGVDHARAQPAVIRQLSQSLRRHDWRVTAFVRASDIRGTELVGAAGPGGRAYGLCVDLGTTKIAAALVDLLTGATLAAAGAPNPQVGYGEDVISRMNYAARSPDGAQVLADRAQAAVNGLLGELTERAGVSRQQVVEGCIVGNTVMTHLLARLPVRQLGLAPYVAASGEAQEIDARELGLEMAEGAVVYLPPSLGGFVGADHIAMILACGLDRGNAVRLGVDIGTNTEIVLHKPGGPTLSSASCASGPAFEGAHVSEGMRAAAGAIERVRITETGVEVTTIHNQPPVGLCGSGIVDAVAELARRGLLNRQGMLAKDSRLIRQGPRGGEFVLAAADVSGTGRDIVLDQKDINEIQLAKGAIHAGLMILLAETGTAPEEVDEVVVAGAFGSYLDIERAELIGLFPRLPRARYRQVGNAALAGARWLLASTQARRRAERIRQAAQYHELTLYPRFSRLFAMGMTF